jgi:hypothetical protein
MLTNIYYYDIYRPYILSNRGPSNVTPKRVRIADRRAAVQPEPNGQTYILNKSLKDEIVQYAHDVSYGVTTLRGSTRRIVADMEHFNRDVHEEGFASARAGLAEDLDEFAGNYNTGANFMRNQQHSTDLRWFSYEMADNVYYNRERLEMLGLSLSEAGQLSFNGKHLTGLSEDRINIAIGENIQIFSDMHRHTNTVLKEPLSEHMKFKGLSYHYNYKMGAMVADDGFGIIESGLLINKAV